MSLMQSDFHVIFHFKQSLSAFFAVLTGCLSGFVDDWLVENFRRLS